MELLKYLIPRKEHHSGTYSSIVRVTLVDKAPAGAIVYVGGYIKNTWSDKEVVQPYGYYNSVDLDFGGWDPGYRYGIAPGAEWPISDTFKMPARNVTVRIESWVYWPTYNKWYIDDAWERTVALEAVAPPVPPPPPPPPTDVILLARAIRYVTPQIIEPPPVIKEVQLLARYVAEVGVAKELYLLARASKEVTPEFIGVILLDSAERVVIAGDIGVIQLDSRDVVVDAVGVPVVPPEEEVGINWWLWGGLAAVAIVIVAVMVRRK